jgi:hypothetical protein
LTDKLGRTAADTKSRAEDVEDGLDRPDFASRPRPSTASSLAECVGLVGIGAGLMCIFDPDRGRRRRALVWDQMIHALNEIDDAIGAVSDDLGNRARGAWFIGIVSQPFSSPCLTRTRHTSSRSTTAVPSRCVTWSGRISLRISSATNRDSPHEGVRPMKEPTATSDASLVRGYAWHIYPDPATPGALAGDSPFNAGDPRGPGRPPLEPPPGVAALWTVFGKVPTLLNQVEDRAYLVLSDSPKPPEVASGWFVEPARLTEQFELTSAAAVRSA